MAKYSDHAVDAKDHIKRGNACLDRAQGAQDTGTGAYWTGMAQAAGLLALASAVLLIGEQLAENKDK